MRKNIGLTFFVLALALATVILHPSLVGIHDGSGLSMLVLFIMGIPAVILLLIVGVILFGKGQVTSSKRLKAINLTVGIILIFGVPLGLYATQRDLGPILQIVIDIPSIIFGCIALFTLDEKTQS
jgi:hypothetical protein